MNKYFIYIVLVVIVLVGSYFYYVGTVKGPMMPEMPVGGSAQMMPENSGYEMMPVMPSAPEMVAVSASKNHVVEIIDNEFRPAIVKVKKGESVIWINKMTAQSWPASAMHPTHAVYPEAGGCIASKFDACHGLKTGESWTFTFNQLGQWKYHDHINFGTVKPGTVEVSE